MKIVKLVDISNIKQKKYIAHAIYDGEDLEEAAKEAAELVQGMNYHRNKWTKQMWEGKRAHEVFVFVSKDKKDYQDAVCQAKATKKGEEAATVHFT